MYIKAREKFSNIIIQSIIQLKKKLIIKNIPILIGFSNHNIIENIWKYLVDHNSYLSNNNIKKLKMRF